MYSTLSRDQMWEGFLQTGRRTDCIRFLQQEGWSLLSDYLNGGLGRIWWAYPLYLGSSNVLHRKAEALRSKWSDFYVKFAAKNPMQNVFKSVPELLSIHYKEISSLLAEVAADSDSEKFLILTERSDVDQRLDKLVSAIQSFEVPPIAYFFHGSIGSGDAKPGWSDVDGLALVSRDCLEDDEKLKTFRRQLIDARKYMVDYLPIQLHGHFVLAEPDLVCYPSPMFPYELFKYAKCISATRKVINLNQRNDPHMALYQLWNHGIKDLLASPKSSKISVLRKVAFLHRVYLLPCLVAQAYGEPLFKKEAFYCLHRYFLDQEIQCINRISSFWEMWTPPDKLTLEVSKIAMLARFNPILYQKISHKVVNLLPWVNSTTQLAWEEEFFEMRTVAKNVWKRTVRDIQGSKLAS